MSRRVEFRLTMPGRGGAVSSSWGAGRNYVLVRPVPESTLAVLLPDGRGSWVHAWDDGWVARILARVMEPGERPPKSDGFGGYDWMVDNILAFGDTRKPEPAR